MEVGNIVLSAISDGTFVARPGYFGDDAAAEGHRDLFGRRGQAWLPIGCFLIRCGDRCVLVDAGMGPTESSAGDEDDPCRLFGGQLPARDHLVRCGRLALLHRRTPRPLIQGHVQQGFRSHAGDARLRPIDRATTVTPGITAVQTPGHTPGHLRVVVSSEGRRALLLGDAITCPMQLDEPAWHSIGDVDPDLANRTREHLWRELGGGDITGTGADFPELKFGRVLKGSAKRWWT